MFIQWQANTFDLAMSFLSAPTFPHQLPRATSCCFRSVARTPLTSGCPMLTNELPIRLSGDGACRRVLSWKTIDKTVLPACVDYKHEYTTTGHRWSEST